MTKSTNIAFLDGAFDGHGKLAVGREEYDLADQVLIYLQNKISIKLRWS